MDNSPADNQNMQLQAMAHEVCRSHSARPDRDLYRICPSKLSKRELEDLYFSLLENNVELKRTINSQNDKLKMLSTKVQRLSVNKTLGSKDKDCSHSKTLIDEQKDSITELRKCNERMAERIRILNMRLCSAKQFLKKQPTEPKNSSKNQSKNVTSFQRFKNICDKHAKPHQPAIEYKISKSTGTSTDNPLVIASPKSESTHECNENKCKSAIEELQQKIRELQEELHLTQYNYASKLHNLENEIRSVMDENVRARADSRALEEREDDLVGKLRAAEGRGADLETQLVIEKRKVKELETRLKHTDSDKNLAKSLDQLRVIDEKRDSDASAEHSYKIQPRQSFSEPQKKELDVESAVSYYKPTRKASEISIETVKNPRRDEPEVESVETVPSQKSYPKDSSLSVKIKDPKRDDMKVESEGSVPSQKSSRRDSQVKKQKMKPDQGEESVEDVPTQKMFGRDSLAAAKIKKMKRIEQESMGSVPPQTTSRRDSQASVKIIDSKRDDIEVESDGSIPSQKSCRRDSQVSVKKKSRKRDDPETESVGSVPSQKSVRRDSQASVKIKEPKRRLSKVEPEVLENDLKQGPSSKDQRKQSISEPKRRHSKVESEVLENKLEEGPSLKGQQKQSIFELKHRDSKVEPEILENDFKEGPSKGQRKPSIYEPKYRDLKVEPEILENELKEELSKGQRKPSTSEPKNRDSKVEPEILENELKEGPSKGQRKPSNSEPKRRDSEVEPEILENEFTEGPSSKDQRKQSITESKRRDSKVEPEILENEFKEGPSSKDQRKQSITEPKRRDFKVESEILENEPKEGLSKGQRKPSISELKYRDFKVEPEILENELKEGPSKGQRKPSIFERKRLDSKVEPEILENELKEECFSKGQRKQSITEPKHRDSKVEPEILENEQGELSSKGQRKQSITEPKHRLSKDEPKVLKNELEAEPSSKRQRKQSITLGELETKPSHEVNYPKTDDSGYIDHNKSFNVETEKDEEMLRINRELLKKVADLKTQLDLLIIAAAGAKQNEPTPAQSKPSSAATKMMEDNSVPLKRSSMFTAEVPNIIEPNQLVEAKAEDKIEGTPSSVKPEVVQNAKQIPKPLTNEDTLLKHDVPYEFHEQKPFSYKNSPENFFAPENLLPPPLEKKKSLANEKSPILFEDQMEQPIPYEIRVPRSSLYPELIQKTPQNNQEVKSKPKEERDAIPASYVDKVPVPQTLKETIPTSSTNDGISIQDTPLLDGAPLSSYEVIAQRPWLSDDNLSIMFTKDGPLQLQKTSSPYDGTIHKSTLHENEKLTGEKLQHKEYVDKKRESLFFKDEASVIDKTTIPNVNKKLDSLFYEKMQQTTLPFEDKIYPDDLTIDERLKSPDQYLNSNQEQFLKKRNPSLYAERIEKFSFEDNAPTTSSPYEEKMKKLHDDKLHYEDDMKSIRFESYIHMAESNSKEYGPDIAKCFEETPEDDPENPPKEKRRRSSTLGTSKADDHNGYQIPGPIPTTPKPSPIDKKKNRHSIDKMKKGGSEEKTVTIFEDDKPSGYSININKIDSTAPGYLDDVKKGKKNVRKPKGISISDVDFHIKPRGSTDFSQVTDNPKEIKDMYQNTSYNSKTPQVQSYFDMVGEGNDIPPVAMQEQSTQINYQIENLQAPVGTSRRDSATYTQTDVQPQTYTVPKDAYTQPKPETLDQKTYTQDETHDYPQPNIYKRDTYTHNAYNHNNYPQVGPQNGQTPRYSRSTSPDNTEKEISSLPDLPQEKEIKSTQGYLSPGEKATMTFTDNETNTDYGSLSEGELPGTKKATKSFGEKGVETTSRPEESPTQRMEDVLQSISEELARCHRLLASQKRDENTVGEVKPAEDDGVQLRASQGTRRLSGSHHVCVFTLHIGTLILSDEAVMHSRDKSLVLTWRFYDSSVTMTRMRPGRVVLFDFSTEYDIVFSEDFINYMKFENLPLLICDINKQDKPFATCSLPLRDALLHVNRRADMSLALSGGDSESSSEEMGVLDLWYVLRCDAVITQHLAKTMARPSTANMSARRSYNQSIVEEELSNERMSEDLNLNIKKESRAQENFTNQLPMNNKKSYSGYLPTALDGTSQPGDPGSTTIDDLSTSTGKMSKRKISLLLPHPRLNIERKDVNFDGTSNWNSNKFPFVDTTGLIANAVPSNIRSTEEMKAALERNTKQEESWKTPKVDDKALSRKNQLSKLKFTKKLSEDVIADSLQDLISKGTSDRKNSQPKYELAIEKSENDLSKKYNDISKLMVSRMDAAKKSVKYYSDEDEQPQRGVQQEDPSPQSIEITVLWLALNEECDAMVNPDIKRLYVAYKFLGRNGAELETPVSLPKPKHYVDKCFFNFKKTFHLHDADLPALGHMARVRAGSRVSTDPRDCLVFTVVSEPPEDPLGLANCEDVGYAYLYLGDILAYSSGSGAYTEVVAVHAARGSAVCGVLAVKIDGLHVLRRALTLSYSAKDLTMAN